MLQEPAYRAGGFSEDASEESRSREAVDRLLSPSQWASSLSELTGFEWKEEGWEQLKNDRIGHRVLAGGVDGDGVDRPASSPSMSQALVVKRLAQLAAEHVVDRDLLSGQEGGLLRSEWWGLESSNDRIAALSELHWRLLARRPSAEEAEALHSLFEAVESHAGEQRAWQSAVSVLLRDTEFVSY